MLELPVVIHRGTVTDEISKFARELDANTIATAESPSPHFKSISQQIRQLGFAVEVYQVEPFLDYEGQLDLKRFSRYGRVAQKYVFDQQTTDRNLSLNQDVVRKGDTQCRSKL